MPILQWFLLFLLSLLISLIFLWLHLPAAMLLGPMIAGIVLSLRGSTLQLPRGIFLAAQAILGCMIAQNLTGSILVLTTLLLAIVAGIAGRLMRIPSGTMLLPMLAGALLHSQGIIEIELPEWLLAVAYMAIGWRIGLGFDRQVFFMALRPLPQILLSIFALMAICAAMAWGMAYYMQIDFMTAYLATSPGGLDTVAAIAAGSSADMALIMAMQTLRLFSILLTGPAVARFISTYAPRQPL
ncbi:AbrB family transcriptional regulator [Salmonella enterica]|nr:AbrB family transcriptional regulator [Salmonella enterica]